MASKLPCLWEKSQKRDFFDVSEDVVMSFCVAGVALCDPSYMFHDVSKVVSRGRRNTFATFSDDALHFSWQAQHFETSDDILRGRRSTLDVSCCVFSANLIVSAPRSGDKVQIPWQVWHFVTILQ